MSILKIARLGHPVLYQKAAPVKNISDPSIKKLIHDMIVTMLDGKGIGLSAPQVHISKQIIIFNAYSVNNGAPGSARTQSLLHNVSKTGAPRAILASFPLYFCSRATFAAARRSRSVGGSRLRGPPVFF